MDIIYFLAISIGIFFLVMSPYLIYIDFRKRADIDRYECEHCHHFYSKSILRANSYRISGVTQVKCPNCGNWTNVITLKNK